jgi:chromosome segregation ATPase
LEFIDLILRSVRVFYFELIVKRVFYLELYYCSKKIEEIGKMTSLSQEEIISGTKTIMQGLDTLKNEHHQILNGLLSSMKTIKKENEDTNLMEEKTNRLKKSLETIELGLSEAQVSLAHQYRWQCCLYSMCHL